jgi:hypothetical protein
MNSRGGCASPHRDCTMTKHGWFPFATLEASSTFSLLRGLQTSMTAAQGLAGIAVNRQLPAFMKTAAEGLSGLRFTHQLQGSMKAATEVVPGPNISRELQKSMRAAAEGLAGLGVSRQLQESMRTAVGGLAGLDLARQRQASMKAADDLAGIGFSRNFQASLRVTNELAGLGIAQQFQAAMRAAEVFAAIGVGRDLQTSLVAQQSSLSITRQPRPPSIAPDGLAGLGLSRQLLASMKTAERLTGLDVVRQVQTSMNRLGAAGQLAIADVASGLLGPTAALRLTASLANGSFEATKFSALLNHMTSGMPMDRGTGLVRLEEEVVFDPSAWAEVTTRLAAWLKVHHVGLILFLLAAVHQQVLFSLAGQSSDDQARDQANLEEHRHQELAQRAVHEEERLQQIATQLETTIKQLATLQYEVASRAGDGDAGVDDSPSLYQSRGSELERRLVARTTRLYAHARSKAAAVGVAPAGEVIFVLGTKREWLYVAYVDVVGGSPVMGWIRKKYTRGPI